MHKLLSSVSNRKNILYTVALLLVMTAFFTHFSLPLVLLTIYTLSLCLPSRGTLLGGAAIRLFFATLLIIVSYQVESMLFWVFHIHVSSYLYILLTLAITLLIYWRGGTLWNTRSIAFKKTDFILILPAIIITGLYTARVILPAEADTLSTIRTSTIAGDDVAHFMMYDALLRNGTNLLVHSKDANIMAIPSQSSYPMGWHLSSAVIMESAVPDVVSLNMTDTIYTYFWAKVASLFLTILSISVLTYTVVAGLYQGRVGIWKHIALFGVIALSTFLLILPQIYEGFFSYLAVLIYFATSAAVYIDLTLRKKNNTSIFHEAILVAGIIGSALTWILTAPALILTFVAYLLNKHKRIRDIPLSIWALLLVGGFATAFQIWVIATSSNASVSALSAPGGITMPDLVLFTILNAVIVGAVILSRNKPQSDIARAILTLLVPLYLVMSVVLIYIALDSPVLTYYFYKIQIASLFITLPVALTYLIIWLWKVKQYEHPLVNDVYQLMIFIGTIGVLIPSVVGYGYFQNTLARTHSYTLNHEDAALIKENVLSKEFGEVESRDYFFYPDSPPRTILSISIARVGYSSSSCEMELYRKFYSVDTDKIATALGQCAYKIPHQIVVYTDQAGSNLLHEKLAERKLSPPNLKVVTIDGAR